ncbi:GNAT family protein [Luteococcus peritonei]|uniref:GNAT family protein n=1 Tax=Luteococcus peritonei TaxID=88874 RepID=A0ABW4RUB8_9ACTN
METLEQIYPPFGLHLGCGPLELRHVREADVPAIVELIRSGIYEPAELPFLNRWAELEGERLARNTLQFYYDCFASSRAEAWHLVLAVRHEGRLVGVQDMSAKDFAVVRSIETGSWLAREHQGRGIGRLMRQAVCAFGFDVLGAVEMTSGYFEGNRRSQGVSRAVGYRPNGSRRSLHPDGDVARVEHRVVLHPEDLVRPPHPVEVSGEGALLRFLGL